MIKLFSDLFKRPVQTQLGGFPYVENAMALGQWKGVPNSIPYQPGMTDAIASGQWAGVPYRTDMTRDMVAPKSPALGDYAALMGLGQQLMQPKPMELPPMPQAPMPSFNYRPFRISRMYRPEWYARTGVDPTHGLLGSVVS